MLGTTEVDQQLVTRTEEIRTKELAALPILCPFQTVKKERKEERGGCGPLDLLIELWFESR